MLGSVHHPAATQPAIMRPPVMSRCPNAAVFRHCGQHAVSVSITPSGKSVKRSVAASSTATKTPLPTVTPELAAEEWDAVVIGSGVGGLTTATQMAKKGAKVLVLERYIIPGGSAGQFEREGFLFDVGSSMMFGLSDRSGGTNLITQALAAVGKRVESIPDPTQLEYHLPKSERFPDGLNIKVWCDYERFLDEMYRLFPHEKEGIKGFYDECWKIFNSLNSMELRSLEEIRFLMSQFVKQPVSCLTLAAYAVTNTGEVARKHIKDPELLNVIDIECYCWSTVRADLTPLINTGMVLCDRFYGGINYPKGGVGVISRELAAGLEEHGSKIAYKANVKEIILEGSGETKKAVGVRLIDGTEIRSKVVVSNATRWDTFGKLLDDIPENEAKFRKRYTKAPSFITLHLGVKADVLPMDLSMLARPTIVTYGSIKAYPTLGYKKDTECHHIIVEDWDTMEDARGTLFVSIPSLLDPSLAPEGTHTFHAFAPEFIDEYKGLSGAEYDALKEKHADDIIARLDRTVFPGLKDAIVFREVGSPRTHQKFLAREDGTYGPVPMRPPLGILNMPFSSTDIQGLYCAGDSTFPGQGVNAVVFSGFGCAHRALVDMGREKTWPTADKAFNNAMKALRYNA